MKTDHGGEVHIREYVSIYHDERSVVKPSRGLLQSPAGFQHVVRLVAEGRTNRQIAQDLVLSSKTVANHVATARRKLRAPSRTALAVVAIAAGVIEHPTEQPRG